MSIKRIDEAFARCGERTALIPFITCGDPSAEATLAMMHAMVKSGVDVIELGVPFSDPMADGKVIQLATERAIANGMTLKGVIEVVRRFREDNQHTPIVFMGYANPIEAMGWEQFTQAAAEAGVDGVLIVDYPPEEFAEVAPYFEAAELAPIFLIAPTSTDERIKKVGEIAKGYVYYVSLKGVTGSGALDTDDVKIKVQNIKRFVNIPVGVGFGIQDVDSARAIAAVADAVVIGSKLITTVQDALAGQAEERHAELAAAAAGAWLADIRQGLDTFEKE
ncbi:tryptophan synthase subunit alpha [Oligella urethralis]|uniref:Tryptophan synthase alpha chain n=1 Tax=Oligella urethralis TaxID=90245 RepID=A0A2N6QGS6_9BURK|nr:tryptophan synthase subunit alpha [Oligella urethralis]PMC18782.1 tryptophan synthase subunit alpha [Oligella urethralis]SPY07044.1 Tryptophan synthase alpha chain [Oligella urethralis]SUA59943.1 Tryptophan synthase alpha chain [Oligella urethralis]SUA65509.1 Tryptophan synthase alpha chain [Oligella urethralis]SUA94669.1 Tryptophan synthase alpha chain [Oligella urethralis]